MTTDDAAGPIGASRGSNPAVSARGSTRKRRSHAALGSRVFVGGLAISGTVGLAGMMARRPAAVAASTPREALLTIVASPARARTAPATARIAARHTGAVLPASGASSSGAMALGAPASSATPGAPAQPAPAATAPAPVAAPVAAAPPAPVAVAPPVTAPPVPAPTSPAVTAPRPVAPPPTAPTVVSPPPAPPVTTSHASPPPP